MILGILQKGKGIWSATLFHGQTSVRCMGYRWVTSVHSLKGCDMRWVEQPSARLPSALMGLGRKALAEV